MVNQYNFQLNMYKQYTSIHTYKNKTYTSKKKKQRNLITDSVYSVSHCPGPFLGLNLLVHFQDLLGRHETVSNSTPVLPLASGLG